MNRQLGITLTLKVCKGSPEFGVYEGFAAAAFSISIPQRAIVRCVPVLAKHPE